MKTKNVIKYIKGYKIKEKIFLKWNLYGTLDDGKGSIIQLWHKVYNR